ncbi:hypothetical protein K8T06_07625 [bacterium]|nr:hypothetical protein [bacterium]
MSKYSTRLTFTLLFSCMLMVVGYADTGFAWDDHTPPVIDKTEPPDGMLGVSRDLIIQVWIFDPADAQDLPGSGVDPDTVRLSVSNVEVPVVVQDIGNNRVWVYSKETLHLPASNWIRAHITAKDRAGNRMEPYLFVFLTEKVPDNTPPVIDKISPPDRSSGNLRHPVIHCRVFDESSAIDLNSILFIVNNEEVLFTYAVEVSYTDIFHVPNHPFEYEENVICKIYVSDIPGNTVFKQWEFQVCEAPPEPPKQNHPADGALLNYQWENGGIRFIWTSEISNELVRLRLKPADLPVCNVLDLGPEDFWISGHMSGYNLVIGHDLWSQYSKHEYMEWSIAVIDHIGGTCLTEYSEWSKFCLAPPDAVVIRTPFDRTNFSAFGDSPLFSWDSFDGARSYLFGIAKLNASGDLFESKLTLYVESEVTSIRLIEQTWRQLGKGRFVWAVLAELESGVYSDFMNYQFTRYAPVIIDQPLSIQ